MRRAGGEVGIGSRWRTTAATGSFLIGFLATLTDPEGRYYFGSQARQFVLTGILGGDTTFSSFSLQTANLIRDGQFVPAGANIAGSVVLCLAAMWLGPILIEAFVPVLDGMMGSGLVTLEKVQVLQYGARTEAKT